MTELSDPVRSRFCQRPVGIFINVHGRIQSTIRKGNRRKNTIFTLNLMSDTPKKPDKKSRRKAKQRVASVFTRFAE